MTRTPTTLVTGDAGFIGVSLVHPLLSDGEQLEEEHLGSGRRPVPRRWEAQL